MRIRWRNLELPNRVICEETSTTYGKFVVEPFERGFGITVGNALRRILLSSLEGTAITSMRINGVDHEFMAIKGVYEDVTDIILNVKQVLISLDGDEPTTVTLRKEGKGVVRAGDITTDHRTTVVNADLPLCTIVDDKTALEMWFTVKRGRGFVTADENSEEAREIGTIFVDSLFSPVKRVRYRTENTRVGKMTNYDKLILEIWTDGTISPEMSLVEASKILRKHLNPFVQYFEVGRELGQESRQETAAVSNPAPPPVVTSTAPPPPVPPARTPSEQAHLSELRAKLEAPVGDLDLSQRSSNCLKAENIKTIGDLVRRSENEMMKVKNFGKTSLDEVKRKLQDLNLQLGMDVDEILATAAR